MQPEYLLAKLLQFDTTNDPRNDKYPSVDILKFIEDLVINQWKTGFKSRIFEDSNYYSLYLSSNLDRGDDILFLGHLDVVPVNLDAWDTDPYSLTVKNGIAYGRGSKDCKGSVISSLLALKILLESNKREILNKIGFLLTLDEETGGRYGTKKFFEITKEKKTLPKYIINVDGGPRIVYKRRAGFGIKITCPPNIIKKTGKKWSQSFYTQIYGDENRHSAYFVKGVDTHAVVLLSKMLHLNRSWKINNIDGLWVKGNVIPGKIEVQFVEPSSDLRFSEVSYDENLTRLIRKIRSLVLIDVKTDIISEFGITVNPNLVSYDTINGTDVYFDVRAFLRPHYTSKLIDAFKIRLGDLISVVKINCSPSSGYFFTNTSEPLIKIAKQVLAKHSLFSDVCEQEGASDARFATAHNIPVIDLGPKGGRIHGPNEFIELNSMKKYAIIYSEIVENLISKIHTYE